MAAINPYQNPEAYDQVTIGGVTWRLCKLSGFRREHEFDVKKGKGTIGATMTFVARPPVKGTIRFYFFRAGELTGHSVNDWEVWDQQMLPALLYDPTKKKVQPVDIYNPKLARVKVGSVVTENVGIEDDEGDKKWFVDVDFSEFFPAPAKSAVSTPDGSKSGKGGTAGGSNPNETTADDAQQKEIADLLKKAQE